MRPALPIHKDVVLVGGGHSHVEVLRRFGMKPVPGVRLTLVTPDLLTPYSGMLPGYVSGFYSMEECHIDLVRLAQYADARLILGAASGIDHQRQEVILDGRPPLPYDVLSINIGITPATSDVPGAAQYATRVKPISTFAAKLDILLKNAAATTGPFRVAVVGGGPGGIELAAALQHRLTQERLKSGNTATATVALISRNEILSELAPYARHAMLPILQQRALEIYENCGGAAEVNQSSVTLVDGTVVPCDACLWCTQAEAAPWLGASGLPTDENGFLLVNEYLQSDGGPSNIFAAGDATASKAHPRPKAGVYAVRAGPPLAENIARCVQGFPLRSWTPQSTNLNLISAGDKYAVGVKGWFGWQGAVLWNWKDWIDRKFMAKYGQDLDFSGMMNQEGQGGGGGSKGGMNYPVSTDPEAVALAAAAKMRCGGCGSKVGATTLNRVLKKLQLDSSKDSETNNETTSEKYREDTTTATNNNNNGSDDSEVLIGLGFPDDAAVLAAPPPGHVTIHTIDFFKAPAAISDPFIFGAIAATHALSDCYAMGATPTAALAVAVLPFAAASKVEADLLQLMAGATKALNAAGCRLVGGHTSEGAELALGFSIYGIARPEDLMKRGSMKPGQALILTKPLGTGVILAAAVKGEVSGRCLTGAIDSMLSSNADAAEILREFGANACTDVTGFGLLGHLAEMAAGSQAVAVIHPASVPLLQGAQGCVTAGTLSSLHLENAKVSSVVDNAEVVVGMPLWPLLVDPQTSGGLLASVPVKAVEQCLEKLRKKGYLYAAVIGRVVEGDTGGVDDEKCIRIEL